MLKSRTIVPPEFKRLIMWLSTRRGLDLQSRVSVKEIHVGGEKVDGDLIRKIKLLLNEPIVIEEQVDIQEDPEPASFSCGVPDPPEPPPPPPRKKGGKTEPTYGITDIEKF